MFLEALHLKKSFCRGAVRAVRDVSFALDRGKTLGVVGESGSGKSTIAKIILRLLAPDAGEILFEGARVDQMKKAALKDFRKKVQVVFQDPGLSLDPRMKVADILKESYRIRGIRQKRLLDQKVEALLAQVELPEYFSARFPHELSGGECQRVAIARAISTDPELVVCDEPVSSLDVLVRAQILNLFLKLQKDRGVSYLFISHDLGVIRHLSDEILVMKGGEVCERGETNQIFSKPQHAYTRFLMEIFYRSVGANETLPRRDSF
jgi:ABC-type glutathione transport system ATPase component